MKRRSAFIPVLFSVIVLIFILFIVWYLPSSGSLQFRIDDIGKSIETSRGRERKQQVEFDEVLTAIPEVRAEIERVRPLADQAEQEVADLKAERKKLRNEKKELETKMNSSGTEEASAHD